MHPVQSVAFLMLNFILEDEDGLSVIWSWEHSRPICIEWQETYSDLEEYQYGCLGGLRIGGHLEGDALA